MIRGVVNDCGEATVRLRVRGPDGFELGVDVAVDTGFNASLTLSPEEVAVLGLVYESSGEAALADGSVRHFDIYEAELEWGQTWRPVSVSAVGDMALLGMRLLAGHELRIEVVPGGIVEITPLP